MSDVPQPQREETRSSGEPPDPRGPKRIPFRERLLGPSLEYRSAIGKRLARSEISEDYAGNNGKTYTILLRYWHWTPEDDVRPLIFLMSD